MKRFALCLMLSSLAPLSAAEAPLTERLQHGRDVYLQHCASCHEGGEEGAPMLSQPAQWSDRSDLWEAVLFEHARNGIGNMPEKGGDTAMPNAEMEAAAEYILSVVYPDRTTD
jgi:cytochrome c5